MYLRQVFGYQRILKLEVIIIHIHSFTIVLVIDLVKEYLKGFEIVFGLFHMIKVY